MNSQYRSVLPLLAMSARVALTMRHRAATGGRQRQKQKQSDISSEKEQSVQECCHCCPCLLDRADHEASGVMIQLLLD